MASSRSTAVPTKLTLPRDEFENKIRKRISAAREVQCNPGRDPDGMGAYLVNVGKWRDYNLDLLRASFTDDSIRKEYYRSALESYVGDIGPQELAMIPKVGRNVESQIAKLESILDRLEFIDMASATEIKAHPPRDLTKVFVVHGHDEGAREAVARALTQFGISPIILHEQASRGLTVIEKVEANSGVGFAVVLLTPDDEGCEKGGSARPRARQNVLLELGYFIGLLGRDNVCAFRRGEVEIPSDFAGVVYGEFDSGGGWRLKLATELKGAGFEIDLNRLLQP